MTDRSWRTEQHETTTRMLVNVVCGSLHADATPEANVNIYEFIKKY